MTQASVTYPCGCVNTVDEEYQILHCIHKCPFHTSHQQDQRSSLEYYMSTGVIDKSMNMLPTNHWAELEEALGPFPNGAGKTLLEVGCGISPYSDHFLNLGYRYSGMDNDTFAFQRMKRRYIENPKVLMYPCTIQDYGVKQNEYNVIFMAHVLEHMQDGPQRFVEIARGAKDSVYVIVPDDRDPTNPDHWWFYTIEGLDNLFHRCGFATSRFEKRSIVPHEDFIFAVGHKHR